MPASRPPPPSAGPLACFSPSSSSSPRCASPPAPASSELARTPDHAALEESAAALAPQAQQLGALISHCAGVVFLRFFHPAFQISVSPFIVMIAFTMILLSIIVFTISYQRFEVLLRRVRAAGGEVEGESVSLGDSLTTALSLGVSNLKKRPSRTVLTVLTVSAVTFSIVAFVSVSGRETISARTVPLERDIEGEMVDPIPPKYDGALFREFYWVGVSDNTISALRTEFGSTHDVVTRGWYIQVEGGNNAERESANQVKIDLGKKSAIVTGVMTFEPGEPEFSGVNTSTTARRSSARAPLLRPGLPERPVVPGNRTAAPPPRRGR